MTTAARMPLAIRRLEPSDLEAAATLLAARHRAHRRREPALDPAYEEPAAARGEIEALLARYGADGWIAWRGAEPAGFLVGIAKDERLWGANVWIEAAGHAAADGGVLRELYAVAAAAWVGAGRGNHHVLVPASDETLVEAWFSLDFGQQHVHAIREVPGASFGVTPRSELTIRRAEREDMPAVAELGRILPLHSATAPIFSTVPVPSIEEEIAELEADWDDAGYVVFVAEHGGSVVGAAVGCDLTVSGSHMGLTRPARSAFLGYAAVLPSARGLGAGRALGEAIVVWSRDAGYPVVAADWRSTNLEAARTWSALGFRPTFRRLHRAIT